MLASGYHDRLDQLESTHCHNQCFGRRTANPHEVNSIIDASLVEVEGRFEVIHEADCGCYGDCHFSPILVRDWLLITAAES